MLACLSILSFVVVAGLHLFYINKGEEDKVKKTKFLLIPLLALFYCVIPSSNFMYLVFFALLFSWFGDVLLSKTENLLYGMIAFTVTHLLYLIAFFFVLSFSFSFSKILLLFPAMAIVAFSFPKYNRYLASLKIPVYIYMGIILLMHSITILGISSMSLGSLLLYIGSLSFILSDTLIARMNIEKVNIIDGKFYIMLTYIFAQLILVLGFSII
jgi:uncharacterized membrane protein YhhN